MKWTEYELLSNNEKVNFFGAVVSIVNTLNNHFTGTLDQLLLSIDALIVASIIRNLLFDSDAEGKTLKCALSVFKLIAAADSEGITHCRCHIEHLKLINVVILQAALGSLFCLASRQIACVRKELSLGYLTGCSEPMTTQFVCICAVACLQKITEVFKSF